MLSLADKAAQIQRNAQAHQLAGRHVASAGFQPGASRSSKTAPQENQIDLLIFWRGTDALSASTHLLLFIT